MVANCLPNIYVVPANSKHKAWASRRDGIPENLTIDQSKHSVFGVSKVAADLMLQEHDRYFGLDQLHSR
jgi:hypothetical protein